MLPNCRLLCLRFINVNLPRLYAYFWAADQLNSAYLRRCRCHVRRVEPVIVFILYAPVRLNSFALLELGQQLLCRDVLRIASMLLIPIKLE